MVQPVAGLWYLEGVVPRLQGYFFYTDLKYMWSLGGIQKNKYVYVAHKLVTDTNTE